VRDRDRVLHTGARDGQVQWLRSEPEPRSTSACSSWSLSLRLSSSPDPGAQRLVQGAGLDGELPAAAGRGGALVAGRAEAAGGGGEFDHDRFGAALCGRAPGGAGLPLRAGHLLGVRVDGEITGGVPGPGPGAANPP